MIPIKWFWVSTKSVNKKRIKKKDLVYRSSQYSIFPYWLMVFKFKFSFEFIKWNNRKVLFFRIKRFWIQKNKEGKLFKLLDLQADNFFLLIFFPIFSQPSTFCCEFDPKPTIFIPNPKAKTYNILDILSFKLKKKIKICIFFFQSKKRLIPLNKKSRSKEKY